MSEAGTILRWFSGACLMGSSGHILLSLLPIPRWLNRSLISWFLFCAIRFLVDWTGLLLVGCCFVQSISGWLNRSLISCLLFRAVHFRLIEQVSYYLLVVSCSQFQFDWTGLLLVACCFVHSDWEYNETVHQLFIDFKKAYDTVRRDVLCNILIEFGVPMKLVRLIEMCLNET
jgi:hypothetical protein